jgi:hypothetical protein
MSEEGNESRDGVDEVVVCVIIVSSSSRMCKDRGALGKSCSNGSGDE